MKHHQNKVVLVTGGNSGIGLATAKAFHEQGARVIVTARSNESFALAQKELGDKFKVIRADVSKVSEIKKMISTIKTEFGHLDIVFANAGISKVLPVSMIDEAIYDELFDTNVKGVFYTIKETVDLLKDGGSIVINASVAADIGFAGGSVYGATKSALKSFARHFAAEYASRKIRVNSVSPGLIETPIYGKLGLDAESMKGLVNAGAQNPTGRVGQSNEVAETVLFLASPAASFINGVDLKIDGGAYASPISLV